MKENNHINNYDNIIWDWNGTLLNDVSLCIDFVNKMLVNQNQDTVDERGYKDVFGFPIVDYYEKMGLDLNKESFEVITQQFISFYGSGVKDCSLFEHAEKVLEEFRSLGMNQFILTAAHKESVIKLLEHYSIKDYFNEVEGLDNYRAESKVEKGKNLIEKNQIYINKAVLIGDTIHDYEVAKEIGVDCILIANGHQSKKRLEKMTNNKICILNKIEELINFQFSQKGNKS